MISPDAVAATRKALNMTQQMLAKKANVSQSLIAKLERGLLKPSYDAMTRINAALVEERSSDGLTAGDFVKSPPVCCAPEDTLQEVIGLMNRRQFSQLPVKDGGAIVGMVTERDLLHGIVQSHALIKETMSSPPPIIPHDAPAELVYALFDHVDLLLIMKQGKLHGVITPSDIFRVLRKK